MARRRRRDDPALRALAALALADSRTTADPFRPTATARTLLEAEARYRNLAEPHGLAPAARRAPPGRLTAADPSHPPKAGPAH